MSNESNQNGLATPISGAMPEDIRREPFGLLQTAEPEEVRGEGNADDTRAQSEGEPEETPESVELGLLREEHDRQAQELANARTSLEQMQRERDIYRQLSGIAESNELKLHRKLSEYTDQEMAALRRRTEELERRMGEDAMRHGN